jgi:hypothetical protein
MSTLRSSHYHDALRIDAASSAKRIEQAAQRLASGTGLLLLDDRIALRRTQGWLACEVIDPAPGARRCAVEYEVLVENAQRALEASRIAECLPALPRKWTVIEVHGDSIVTAWPSPDA